MAVLLRETPRGNGVGIPSPLGNWEDVNVLGAGLIALWGSALSVGCGLFMMVTNWTLVNRVTGPTLVKARVTRQPTVARF